MMKPSANDSMHSRLSFFSKMNYLKGSLTNMSDRLFERLSISPPEAEVLIKNNPINPKLSDPEVHWENIIISDGWGSHANDFMPYWDDEKRIIKHKTYHDLVLTEEEQGGVLTDRIIVACSSYLDKSPEVGQFVLCKCDLSNKSLTDITPLKYYHYLQYLDVSHNRLTTLEPLGQLPFLCYLDASENMLTEILDFKAPFNLTFANLSSNGINAMKDLSAFWSLVVLDLSRNSIHEIFGLDQLKYLRDLNLSSNEIRRFENLSNMNLRRLDLYDNKIYSFEEGEDVGLKTNVKLKHISLSKNNLDSLALFEDTRFIQVIDVSENSIIDLLNMTHLKQLLMLHELDMRDNPIRSNGKYFDVCMDCCKHIKILDGEMVTAAQKVLSRKRFDNSTFTVNKLEKQHSLLRAVNFPNITLSTIPYVDTPPPMIALVGPPACLKGMLVDMCCEIFPTYAIRGINHTTRPRTDGEIDGEQYHFISYDTFTDMLRKGLFLTTSEYFGHFYGFARTEVTKVAGMKKALIFHTDMNGALILRARGLRPTLVLTIPKTEEAHLKYMEKKYYCHTISPGLLEVGLNKIKAYEGLQKAKIWNQRRVVSRVSKLATNPAAPEQQTDHTGGESYNSKKTPSNVYIEKKSTTGTSRKSSSSCADTCVDEWVEPKGAEASKYKIKSKCPVYMDMELDQFASEDKPLTGELKSFIAACVCSDESLLRRSSSRKLRMTQSMLGREAEQETTNIKHLFDEILKTTRTYLEMHWANPGLFNHMIFTDELDEGLSLLHLALKLCVKTYHMRTPTCQMHTAPAVSSIVQQRLENMHKLLTPWGVVQEEKKRCWATQLHY